LFLGHKIVFKAVSNFQDPQFNKLERLRKFFTSLFFKNFNFNKIFLKRFYYELCSYFSLKSNFLAFNSSYFIFNRFLNFIFKLEAIYFVFSNKDFFLSFASFNFGVCCSNIFLDFSNYFFDSYFGFFYQGMKSLVAEKLFNFSSLMSSSDFCIRSVYNEFLYKYSFLYSSFSLGRGLDLLSFSNLLNEYSSNFLVKSFGISNVDLFPIYDCRSFFLVSFDVVFLFPLFVFLNKLRFFGFFHSFSIRPIAFSKYIFKEDAYILFFYYSLLFSFFFWFKEIRNFSDFYFLINLLKKSCLITFSRKYKKSFSWSLNVYTMDLVYQKSVSKFISFFNFSLVENKQAFFSNYSLLFPFGETFFLFS